MVQIYAKDHKRENPKITRVSDVNKTLLLDTTAQLALSGSDHAIKTLEKRAYSKWVTMQIIYPLIFLNSERKISYDRTWHCNNILVQTADGKITSKYCKQRWCITCNRIRTAKLILGYKPVIDKWSDPRMVTLTVKHDNKSDYSGLIDHMGKSFTKIRKTAQRNGYCFKGIRKLETTWSWRNGFHPHYHVIMEGKAQADWLIEEWLKRNPEAKRGGQDHRKCDENSVIEVFKYFTKLWSTKGEGDQKKVLPYPPVIMDKIFEVIRGKRTVQPFGGVRSVSDEITDIQATVFTDENRVINWLWEQDVRTWVDHESGELRT